MPLHDALDELVSHSLTAFARSDAESRWYGREREAVSAQAPGFLTPACSASGVVRLPAQVGIEVAVPQVDGTDRKEVICKVLVIGRSASGTVWDRERRPVNDPMCVME